MSWVSSDRTGGAGGRPTKKEILSMVRGAMIDEISATDLYDKLADLIPSERKVFEEIRRDEINHQGRLMKIIVRHDEDELAHFNDGYDQSE